MKIITATNVNEAYDLGLSMFATAIYNGTIELEDSRAGPVFVWPHPVSTCYINPCDRILWDEKRDANPFFHFMESLWMLAGRNDVGFIKAFNTKMASFSDDGTIYHGAYGYRWRKAFGFDQLDEAISHLRKSPQSRRCVIQMWDAQLDMRTDGLDLPCNCTIKLELRKDGLRMVIFNRSNDMIFGAYGANAVHFSVLQEYIASALGVPVELYYQISCNMHVYKNVWEEKYTPKRGSDLYDAGVAERVRLFTPGKAEAELRQIEDWLDCALGNFSCPAITRVATPLDVVWKLWKAKNRAAAFTVIENVLKEDSTNDWLIAAKRWMDRRSK